MGLTSPVSGSSLSDWQDDGVIFSGFGGSNFPTFWGGVWSYTYDPTKILDGATPKDSGWVEHGGMGEGTTGIGHAVYEYFAYTLSVTGTPTQGTKIVSLNYLDLPSAGTVQEGWNLVGNPFAATVNWNEVYLSSGSPANVWNGYQMLDGTFYDGDVAGGSRSEFIPHSHAFWAQCNASSSLTFEENDKNTGQDPASKAASQALESIKITMSGDVNSYTDVAFVAVGDNYTSAFEMGDMTKLDNDDPNNKPRISTLSSDEYDLAVNKFDGLSSISIPMHANAGSDAHGNYTLTFELTDEFMPNSCIILEDVQTGIFIDIRNGGSYTYNSINTINTTRFLIHIEKPLSTEKQEVTCNGSADGELTISGNGLTGNNLTVTHSNGTEVFNGIATNA